MGQWNIRKGMVSDTVRSVHATVPLPILRALAGRGLDVAEEVERYLNPIYSRDVHDPFKFAHMTLVMGRIAQAIETKQKILIHGDYDADGVTSAAIIATALGILGATYDVFLPHREFDGYGVSQSTIERAIADGVRLLITTDCGIASIQEITYARDSGIDTIIIDHHERKTQLPPAYAIIHPLVDEGYPDKTLTGGGAAFKVLQAIVRTDHATVVAARAVYALGQDDGFSWEGFEKWMLDLVAISTIADCTALTGESRALVHWGLKVLQKTRRPGLQCLLGSTDTDTIDAHTIGFSIAPRLNAAGRMEHAKLAFDLLMVEDRTQAIAKAKYLDTLNTRRRTVTAQVIEGAMLQITDGSGPAVVAYHPQWALGVLGIVAARLSDTFGRPAFVFTSSQGRLVGSARAPDGWSVLKLMEHAHESLERYGGHEQAGGFTVRSLDHIDAFRQTLLSYPLSAVAVEASEALDIDAVMELSCVGGNLGEWIKRCEPFGKGNPEFRFVALDCVVERSRAFKDGKHWELTVRQGRDSRRMVGFNLGARAIEYKTGAAVDVAFAVRENFYQGVRRTEAYVVDVRNV